MSMSVKTFWTYALHITDHIKESNKESCNAWIVPAKFKPLCYINDPRYMGEDPLQEWREKKMRET